MPLTIKQILFLLWFLISWLLLLLIGDSYISYVLLGGISFSSLLFAGELDWKKINQHKALLVLWLLAFLGLGASFIFSVNIPLSLYFATKFIFSFIFFWFFLLIKKSFITRQLLLKLLLLVGIVILLISVAFSFSPSLANLLPGLNLLHATYGHNHLAALLLLIIPLSWWLASEYVKEGRSGWWLLPMLFSLGLLLSFGRVVAAIGLVQFLVIYRQLKLSNMLKNNQLNFLFRITLGLFLIVLLSNTFFSTITFFKPDFSCPVPKLETQLCKSIMTESRPEYWSWALGIIGDNFWFGSGPGTFGLVAPKYHLNPFGGSAHAHNAFLESLAEMGAVGGGLFIVLMMSLLFFAWKKLGKIRKWDWKMATFLGVSAIYLDVLFDFDWEFIGIYSLTFLLLSLIIGDNKSKEYHVNFSNFFKTIYLVLTFSLIGLAVLYLKTDGLIKAKQTQTAFDLFPYFHWHRKIYETDTTLNDESRDKFFEIYQFQTDLYQDAILSTADLSKKQELRKKWLFLAPWSAISSSEFEKLIDAELENQNLAEADTYLEKVWNLSEKYYVQSGRELLYESQSTLIDKSIDLVEQYLLTNQPQLAFKWLQRILAHQSINWEQKETAAGLLITMGNQVASQDLGLTVQAYQIAWENIEWILSQHQLWFELEHWQDFSLEKLKQYVELTPDWQQEKIGWKDQLQQQVQQFVLGAVLKEQAWNQVAQLLNLEFWEYHDYEWRREFLTELILELDKLVEAGNYQTALLLTQALQNFLPNEYWLMMLPGNMAILAADYSLAAEELQFCNQEFIKITGEERHHECLFGVEILGEFKSEQLGAIELKQRVLDRYFQVSQIIRGEATWQDFE